VLEIKVNDEITYRYSHLDSSLVEVGSTVKGGEKVAEVGSTGNSTGPHLHYEIFVNGTATDPFSGFYEAPVELEYEDYSADEEFAGIKLSDALLTVRGRMGSGSEIIRYEKGYTTDKKDAWVISVSTISPTPEPHIVVYYVGGDFCIVEE
jgi:murein DD-endopeptidase MepM/ murein hydrolase activator NlpD